MQAGIIAHCISSNTSMMLRLSYGQVLGECGGVYQVDCFKSIFVDHLMYGQNIALSNMCLLYTGHCWKVCCDQRQGRALGNNMRALTQTEVYI